METNNMNTRARFEEIWPVPECITWAEKWGEYMPIEKGMPANRVADEWDARLDTFTRCQETAGVYVSLVDELIAGLEHHLPECPESVNKEITANLVERAKQILGIEK